MKKIVALFALLFTTFSFNSYAEYRVCRDSIDGKEFVMCDGSCPLGSTSVAWLPSNHSSCGSASKECPSIKKLGWRGGHKTNFCIGLGYGGLIAAAECHSGKDYRDGGWCFKKEHLESCKRELNCAEAVVGKRNGLECTRADQCASKYCMPGPSAAPIAKNPDGGGAWYCTDRDMNCAKPGSDGAKYGTKITLAGKELVCQDPKAKGYWGQFMLPK